MAESRLLHVGIQYKGPARAKELEPVFNKAKDWLRYAPNCWLLWTSTSIDVWSERIREALNNLEDGFFIAELNRDPEKMHGFLTPENWEWINKYYGANE